jgi:hypothetical protein
MNARRLKLDRPGVEEISRDFERHKNSQISLDFRWTSRLRFNIDIIVPDRPTYDERTP